MIISPLEKFAQAGNFVSDELENAVSVLRTFGCQEYTMNFTE
jgi:hypothetical protein